MKRNTAITLLSALVIISSILSSCNNSSTPDPSDTAPPSESNETNENNNDRIKELEAMIQALVKDQQENENKNNDRIAELRAELEKLKEEPTDATQNVPTETKPASEFKYNIVNGMANLTEIISDAENIVIPYTIDGYKVYSIGIEAFSSRTVKSIVISSGIEKIDWFAFKNCPSLVSVSIPETVNSIGYGAFDNAASSFVIRCSQDSFAHRYAQSYGITYDIT